MSSQPQVSEAPVLPATAAEPPLERSAPAATGWLVRRVVLGFLALAILLSAVSELALDIPAPKPALPFQDVPVFGSWCRYDCTWYVDIATRGYYYTPGRQSSVAFFPGYPLAVRYFSRATDLTVLKSAIIVAWLTGVAALVLFTVWCAKRMDRRRAAVAVAVLMLFPYAWFLYGEGYGDAMFLALTIAAFLFLERGHPVAAGLCGAVASATRPVGIALFLGLVVLAIERRGGLPRREPAADGAPPSRSWATRLAIPARVNLRVLRPADLGLLLVPTGLIAWSAWLWYRFDDPFAYSTVQVAWHQAEGPRTWFKYMLFERLFAFHTNDLSYLAGRAVQIVITVAAIAAVPAIARRFGVGYGVYVFLAVGLAAVSTRDFQGIGRYVLAVFPLFALGGIWLSERKRTLQLATFAVFGLGLVFGTYAYARLRYLS
jgi:hypothetical protein